MRAQIPCHLYRQHCLPPTWGQTETSASSAGTQPWAPQPHRGHLGLALPLLSCDSTSPSTPSLRPEEIRRGWTVIRMSLLVDMVTLAGATRVSRAVCGRHGEIHGDGRRRQAPALPHCPHSRHGDRGPRPLASASTRSPSLEWKQGFWQVGLHPALHTPSRAVGRVPRASCFGDQF